MLRALACAVGGGWLLATAVQGIRLAGHLTAPPF